VTRPQNRHRRLHTVARCVIILMSRRSTLYGSVGKIKCILPLAKYGSISCYRLLRLDNQPCDGRRFSLILEDKMIRLECEHCSAYIPHNRAKLEGANKRFCSLRCARAFGLSNAELTFLTTNRPYMSTGNTGAISELVVCTDLLQKGYDVFRALSPSSACDLVALKNGQCYRVEVKTRPHLNLTVTRRQKGLQDVMAVVSHKGEIAYSRPM
jgi:hypothetical protein